MMTAHLALLAVTLIYGLFYVAIKLLVLEMPPWETFTLRLILTVPLIFVLEKLFFNCRIHSKEDLLKILGLGLLGIIFVQSTVIIGLNDTSVFHAGFLVGMTPLITLLLSVLLKQERLNLPKATGMLVAFIGLSMLLFTREGQAHLPKNYLLGDAVLFINIVGWSLFLILSRPMLQKYPAFSIISYAFVLSSLVTLPFIFFGTHKLPGADLSSHGWLWMSFVVLFSTILTYFLNYYALARLPASTVATYIFLQPLFTALFAHLILHEPITAQMLLYGIAILTGVAIAMESYRPLGQWFCSFVQTKD